jgi:6-phosphogluconolactonase (cycloisomerase 2 family)
MRAALAFIVLLLAALPAQAEVKRAYIGTYTFAPGATSAPGARGEGVYLVDFDTVTGKMSAPKLVARTPSPSWVEVDRRRGVLYAANEAGANESGVSAFRIERVTGALTPIGRTSMPGPVQLALAPGGDVLLAASFSGPLAVIPLGADGAPGPVAQTIRMDGAVKPSQVKKLQGNEWVGYRNQTRAHGVVFHPDGRHVVMNDYGLDELVVFALEEGQLRLVSRNPQFPGSATRHSTWDAKGNLLYSVSELDSMVTVSAFDPASGKLTERQRLATLPAGYAGSAAAGEILLSKDGRNLYASNRFYNSIAHFRVGANGLLAYGGDTITGANFPRMLVTDPSGRYLLAGGQNSDSIAIYRIGATGTPQSAGYAGVPTPVTLAFLDD